MQALLFIAFLLLSSVSANFHLEKMHQFVQAHLPTAYPTPATKRNIETARTNAALCNPTNFNRRFWDQKGGTSTLLLGNWEGTGTLSLIHKASTTPIFVDTVFNTWNVTFQEGYIKWIDNFRPASLPPSLGDTFSRYLQSGTQNEWYCCTNIESNTTPETVDYEFDVFGLPTSYSALIDRQTGAHRAACTYHFEDSTHAVGSCTYYEVPGVLPPGILLDYVIYLTKVSA